MRHLVLVAVLFLSTNAAADPKAIEKVVKSHLAELAKYSTDDKLSLVAKEPVVISPRGTLVDMDAKEGCIKGAVAQEVHGCADIKVTYKPGAVTSGTVGDAGWFQVPYAATLKGVDPNGGKVNLKQNNRASGIVVKEGGEWKIAAIQYVETVTDKNLLQQSGEDLWTRAADDTGDNKKVAAAFSGWFEGGLASHAAKGTLIASGTSLAEYKTGAAALKLVQSWDKLKLKPLGGAARLYGDGKVALVTGLVHLPKKGTTKGIPMRLAAVLVDTGSGWQWISLAFQPPF